MNYIPKRTKYKKKFRGNFNYSKLILEKNCYGNLVFRAAEGGELTGRQLESCRRVFSRLTGRQGKIWIKVFPDFSYTKKPNESRMGKGKGEPSSWVVKVSPGRIIFEFEGDLEKIHDKLFSQICDRLPIKIKRNVLYSENII